MMQEPATLKHRSLINAFILLNVVGAFFWSQPFDYQPRTFVCDLVGGYLRFVGLWQHWDMFSPEPRSVRVRMDATVTLRDGSKRTWTFPQMDHMGLFERFRKERFRKWAHDNVRLDSEARIWEPTAHYIARQFADSKNPPVAVALNRHWADIPPPDSGRDPANQPFHVFTFYQTKIAAR
jgi:hypothetical protein